MLAYACSPFRGSEPGLGWWRAHEAAKYHDVTVICKEQNYKEDIRRYYAKNGEVPGLRFVFLPNTRFEQIVKRIPGLFYLAYNFWHRRAHRLALVLADGHPFDLVHQANWVTFREPGYLWKLDLPFVWGPVGGTETCPWRFLPQLGFAGALQEGSRNLLNCVQFNTSPRLRKAVQKAAVLITANSEGQHAFKRTYGAEPVRLLQVGIESLSQSPRSTYDGVRPIRLLWSGRFATNKGLHLLLLALRQTPPSLQYELRILGGGPLDTKWRRLARRHGLEDHCTWMGNVPYEKAMQQFDWADLYVFTSLRDAGATVVVEALGHGVPVICLDHSGARDVVTDQCGVKIPVRTPRDAVSDLLDAIVRIAAEPNRLHALSHGAVERARMYLWERNGLHMARLYDEALTSRIQTGLVELS
jgi:glycosyltransferase involved in cell wall biosynthesis